MGILLRQHCLKALLSWLLTALWLATSAQNPSTSTSCATDEYTAQRRATDSTYRRFYQQLQARALQNRGDPTGQGTRLARTGMGPINLDSTAIDTIPVVFVVYHLGEPVGTETNLPDVALQAAIDTLNRYYAGQFAGERQGIDTRIRFALARRSPACGPSTGVVRVDARRVPGYQQDGLDLYDSQKDKQLRDLLPEYANSISDGFVIVRVMNYLSGPGGSKAWATFGGNIYMAFYTLLSNYYSFSSETSVLTHEMGHALNLYHTFNGDTYPNSMDGCPFNGDPQMDGDQVADTDPHRIYEPGNGCNPAVEEQINPCTGRPFGLIGRNFMSYSCQRLFTPGQIRRMHDFLATSNLTTSYYLRAPEANGAIPVACLPTVTQAQEFYVEGVWSVRFGQIHKARVTSPYELGTHYADYSCGDRSRVTAGESYMLEVGGNGRHRRVYMDYNNDGHFNEETERILAEDVHSRVLDTTRATITIPTTAVTNQFVRMRVIIDNGSTPPTACNLPGADYGSGEAEDYGVLIQPGLLCREMRTVKAGNWTDPAVWSCGRLPTAADTVQIDHVIRLQAGESGQGNRLLYGSGGVVQIAIGATLWLSR